MQLQEFCHRKIDVVVHQDGLKRGIKPAKLQSYIDRYKAAERNQLDVDGTVPPQLPFNAAVQIVKAKLAAEPIDAHSIQGDTIEFTTAHLYFRPVFAFEYAWNNKLGVIEIDGLTGEVIENGEWFRDKVDIMMSREMMFELGAEVASAVVPGSGYAVKLLNKVTQEKPGRPQGQALTRRQAGRDLAARRVKTQLCPFTRSFRPRRAPGCRSACTRRRTSA